MSGGAFVTIKVGRSGTAGDHARYITRERATEGKQERVWTQNVPEYAAHPDHDEQGMSYKERTGDLREYARQLEEDELERPQRGGGEKRTHYRAIYSFDREVTDEKAREMVDAHLAENFPKARAIAAIHRDTDNAHVHVNIAARGMDDKKLHFNQQTHRQLDERWARIYGQEFGREIEKEHLEKKQQWRDWMREARAAKERGEEPPPRPKRVSRERNQVQERREMHAKQYGLNHANQTGIRDDQRRATNGEQPATARTDRAGATPRGTDREPRVNHGTAGSPRQPAAAAERDQQQPGRPRRADRAASNRTQGDDRAGEARDHRAEQTRANPANDAGQERGDEQRVFQPRQSGDGAERTPERLSGQVAGAAAHDDVESDRGDVPEHDLSGAFDRVLSAMEFVTDAAANRGREQVADFVAGHDAGANQADRDSIKPTRREHASSDKQRADADEFIYPRNESPQVGDAAHERLAKRVNAGRWQAQYLVKLVEIGLKERETGENAEADRKELQAIRQEMREAEKQHVKEYGGRPRPVLTAEERDYIAQHRDAPTLAPTRELIKKELAQAYVIGETSGQAFERKPERKQEQEKERTRERDFDRSR
jgi:hypothetical protein